MQRGDGKFGPNLKPAGPPRSLPGAGREPGLAAPRQRHFRADFSACSWQDGSRGALKLGTQILLRNRIWAKAAWRRGWHPILRNTVQLQTTIWPLSLTSSLAKWMAILTGVVCAHRRRARGPSTVPGTCLETRPCLLPPSACTWALLIATWLSAVSLHCTSRCEHLRFIAHLPWIGRSVPCKVTTP